MIKTFAVLGIIISLYAFWVSSGTHKPWCDISTYISCTRVLRHPKATHLGIANGLWGLVFYSLILLFSFIAPSWIPSLALIGVMASIYLAHQQYRIKTFCAVCTTTYLINILLLLLAW